MPEGRGDRLLSWHLWMEKCRVASPPGGGQDNTPSTACFHQYESAEIVSPAEMEPRAIQVAPLIESLMNRTEPSPKRQLTPPGCRLRAPAKAYAKVETFRQGSPPSETQNPFGRMSALA